MLRRLIPRVSRPLSRLSSSSSSSLPAEKKAADLAKVPVGVQQAPNHPTTWSTNQRERPGPQSGPRFEQTIMELQPQPLAAIEMIANEPIRVVQGRKAVCDGGTLT